MAEPKIQASGHRRLEIDNPNIVLFVERHPEYPMSGAGEYAFTVNSREDLTVTELEAIKVHLDKEILTRKN